MLPISIKMENFLSHTNSELDFDFSSALIVGSFEDNERVSNGSGKSSLLESVGWALFGESRHKNADDVVKRGQPTCRVELIFSHHDKKYRIIRTRNVKHSKEEVQFEQLADDGTVTQSLVGDTNKITESKIRETIKSSYEVFVNSSYFRQNLGLDFAEGTFSTRQSLISSLLNLDHWNAYQKTAKAEFTKFSDRFDVLKSDMEKLRQEEQQLIETEALLLELASGSEMATWQRQELHKSVERIEKKIEACRDKVADLQRRKMERQQLKQGRLVIKEASSQIAEGQRIMQRLEQENAKYQQALDESDEKIQEWGSIAERKIGIQNEVSSFERSYLEQKAACAHLQEQISNIAENDECRLCGHSWNDQGAKNADLEDRKLKLHGHMLEAGHLSALLAEAKERLERSHKAEITLQKYDAHLEKMRTALDFGKRQIVRAQQDIEAATKRLATAEESIAGLSDDDGSADSSDVADLEEQLSSAKAQLAALDKKLNSISFEVGALTKEREIRMSKIEELKKATADYEAVSRRATVYGKLAKTFGRDGIQAIIIDNVIEDLTRVANQWLAEFCTEPTHVNFVTQKKNTKGDWKETLDVEIVTPSGSSKFESLSGGERFRVSFAIRLALSMLQARRMGGEVQILLLDEVSTSLDAAGLETFINIVRKLEKTMKIMMITHDDKLKDEFETVINVRRTAAGSTIER